MTTPPGGGGRDDAGPPWAARPPSWDVPPPSWPAGEQTRIGSPGGWGPPPAGPPARGWAPPGSPQPGSPPQGPPQQGPPQPGWGQPAWGQPGPPPGWGQQPPPGSWGAPTRSGWGAQPGWDAPPPSRGGGGGGRTVALLLVGALVLAGLGVGAFLLVRATTAGDTVPADFRETTAAGLTFSVPPEWTPGAPGSGGTVAGAEVEGVQNGAPYSCGGAGYVRVFSGVALLAPGVPPASAAEQVAREAGAALYRTAAGQPAQVSTTSPREVDAGGASAQLVEATVRASADDCLASEGLLLVLAVPVAEGTAVLVVSGDSAGGPSAAPAVPERSLLEAVVASARPGGGI